MVAHNHFIIVAISWLSSSLRGDPFMDVKNITIKELKNNNTGRSWWRVHQLIGEDKSYSLIKKKEY